jgi:hypothetical protein
MRLCNAMMQKKKKKKQKKKKKKKSQSLAGHAQEATGGTSTSGPQRVKP